MENIKLETDLRLETIFLSINKDNLNKLDELKSLRELDVTDRNNINKFIYLINQTGTLTIDTLKIEFPDLYFDEAKSISGEALDDYIRLYIGNVKNNYIARELFKLSNEIKTNGMTESIVNRMTTLSK